MRQLLLSLLGAAALGLALPAAAQAPGETLRFQDYPGAGNLLIRVARSKGYCKAAGITCELKMIPAAPLGLQALIGGSIDVAETPIDVVAAAVLRGAKVKTISGAAVSAIFQIDVAATLPLPNQGKGYPAEMQDLKGRKVGVTARGAASESFFSFLMEQAGLRADDVTYVSVGAPNTAFAALRAGQVDAIVSWEPSGTLCAVTKLCKVLFMGATATKPVLLQRMYGAGTGLVMRTEDLQKHPEIAQAVIKVSRQAEAFVNDPANKDEVLKISNEYFKYDMPQGDYIARQTLDLSLQAGTFKTMVRRSAVNATLEYLKLTKQLATVPTVQDLVWDQAPTE
ncbi:MAG: ABC transporter substrate-binding protein [Rhodoferax sp.]|nr:ABC transporter substrate-binding protein [Rhodoferax sp.]